MIDISLQKTFTAVTYGDFQQRFKRDCIKTVFYVKSIKTCIAFASRLHHVCVVIASIQSLVDYLYTHLYFTYDLSSDTIVAKSRSMFVTNSIIYVLHFQCVQHIMIQHRLLHRYCIDEVVRLHGRNSAFVSQCNRLQIARVVCTNACLYR